MINRNITFIYREYNKLKHFSIKKLLDDSQIVRGVKRSIGAKTIHCLGDSHTHLFKYIAHRYFWYKTLFEFCIVDGATTMGLVNPNSKTNAMNLFTQHIEMIKNTDDYLLFCLGEVDCGFVIWYRASKYNISVEDQFNQSLNNYFSFLKKAKRFGFNDVIICGVPLPTILDNQNWGEVANLRKEVTVSIRERTDLTILYNRQLKEYCKNNNYVFIDLEEVILDPVTKIIKDEFRNKNLSDHHLNNHTVGPYIKARLRTFGFV